MTTKTPTEADVKDALAVVEGEHRQLEGPDGRWCHLCDAVECSIVPAVATLRAALASLRSDVAAKDAEIERLREMAAGDEITMRRLEKERDAAENRGFRKAAEWASGRYGKPDPKEGLYYAGKREGVGEVIYNIRAEADRREGKA